jgi:hypothetical protein
VSEYSICVSVGIPTFNRAAMFQKALDSVLAQDYQDIEILISDNFSTDETEKLCEEYLKSDDRTKYIRQLSNIGASANFDYVLKLASGKYFMWLGDDDWIDSSYISSCVSVLEADPTSALVSGSPKYYRDSELIFEGKIFSLSQNSWLARVFGYYWKVADNGMFYGVMRTTTLKQTSMPNSMGGDWHLLANIISTGKVVMLPHVAVHRALGGATESYRHIAKSLGLPMIQAVFPTLTAACGAWIEIVFRGGLFKQKMLLQRVILACGIFFLLLLKKVHNRLRFISNSGRLG